MEIHLLRLVDIQVEKSFQTKPIKFNIILFTQCDGGEGKLNCTAGIAGVFWLLIFSYGLNWFAVAPATKGYRIDVWNRGS